MNLELLAKENLLADGETSADAKLALHPPEEQELPWIAKILLGAGGWLTAIFLSVFTGLLLSDFLQADQEVGATIIGLLYIAASVLVSRFSDQPFLTQLTLAVGTAGLGLVVFGLWDSGDPEGIVSIAAILALCPVIYGLSKNGILKYLSIVCAYLVWWIFHVSDRGEMSSSHALVIAVIIVCFFLTDILKTSFWRPALLATVSGMFFLLYLPMFPDRYINKWGSFDPLLLSAIIAIGFGVTTWLLTKPKSTRGITCLAIYTALLFLVAWFGCAGIAAALGVIIAGQARNDNTLKWVGTLGLVVFVIAFYYFLGKPLLTKSYLLLATGVFLLVTAVGINLTTKTPEA